MTRKNPVKSNLRLLPLGDEAFTWKDFEEFFCRFFDAGAILRIEGKKRKVSSARLYQFRGSKQDGIDIEVQLEGGQLCAVQCKQTKAWTKSKMQKAIDACEYKADFYILAVTADVSSKSEARNLAEATPGWVLWDRQDITREFLQLRPETSAAMILKSAFGPAWAAEFFPGLESSPLVSPMVFFQRWLEEDRHFHHRLPYFGSQETLRKIDNFADARNKKILMLTGTGGVGKSRTLLEWSRSFSAKHPGSRLLFFQRDLEQLETYLQFSGEGLVIVMDDAHRQMELRNRLIKAASGMQNVKLIFALRPGPNIKIGHELRDAGYDPSEVEEELKFSRPNSEQIWKLVDAALGGCGHPDREALYYAAKGSPLIAVVGGTLIRENQIKLYELRSHSTIRSEIYEHLGRDIEQVVQPGFDLTDLKFIRGVIAVLAPIQNTKEFRASVGKLMGSAWSPHRVEELLKEFIAHGVLMEESTHSQVKHLKIEPDLFSDHLVFTACFDGDGGDRGLVRTLLEYFGEESIGNIAQNLAEAEWRAAQEFDNPAEVFRPVFEIYRQRFLKEDQFGRSILMDEWLQFAVLRPAESMELAGLAGDDSEIQESVADLLKSVGSHHSRYTRACLDQLWAMVSKGAGEVTKPGDHALEAMAEISKLHAWKSVDVADEAIDWCKKFFAGDDWLKTKYAPAHLMNTLLSPFLAQWVESTVATNKVIHFHSRLVKLEAAASLRAKVFAICRPLLGDPNYALASLQLADESLTSDNHVIAGRLPKTLEKPWLEEKFKALRFVGEIVERCPHPALRMRTRIHLNGWQRGNDETFVKGCKELLASAPLDLEIRTTIAFFSYDYEQFLHELLENENASELLKQKWSAFLSTLAEDLIGELVKPESILQFLGQVIAKCRDVGWLTPSTRGLMRELLRLDAGMGGMLINSILESEAHPMVSSFALLVNEVCKDDERRKLEYFRRAVDTRDETLIKEVVHGFLQWRDRESLDQECWDLLLEIAALGTWASASSILQFLQLDRRELSAGEWKLLFVVRLPSEHPKLQVDALELLAEMLAMAKSEQPDQVVRIAFEQWRPLDLEKNFRMEGIFARLSKLAPQAIFEYFLERHTKNSEGGNSVPPWFDRLRFPGLTSGKAGRELFEDATQRFFAGKSSSCKEGYLLRALLFHSSGDSTELGTILAERITSENELTRTRALFSPFSGRSKVLRNLEYVRAILSKASEFGDDVRDKLLQDFAGSLSGGIMTWKGDDHEPETHVDLNDLNRLSHEYANDPELSQLFPRAVELLSARIKASRKRWIADKSQW